MIHLFRLVYNSLIDILFGQSKEGSYGYDYFLKDTPYTFSTVPKNLW